MLSFISHCINWIFHWFLSTP